MASENYVKSIQPLGLLSFGWETEPIELGPLNVVIGPNASGKSNFIEVIKLLRGMTTDFQSTVAQIDAVDNLLWRGPFGPASRCRLTVKTLLFGQEVIHSPVLAPWPPQYSGLSVAPKLVFQSETISNATTNEDWYSSELFKDGTIRHGNGQVDNQFRPKDYAQSILSQIDSPQVNVTTGYSFIHVIQDVYRQIPIYDNWQFGRHSGLRKPVSTDQPADCLNEDFLNLPLVLNKLRMDANAKYHLLGGMHDLYEDFTDFDTPIENGLVSISFTERDRTNIPATRLSDGTLHYLCLLAILYNPNPPRVICIEEPELGLHPDIVAGLAKHLLAASERMQLIVTTHSDILVDALTWNPETVIVCENVDGATQMKRLNENDLKGWLKEYSLGQLWTSGHIGGNRW